MLYRIAIFLLYCSIAFAQVGCLVGGSSAHANYAGWFDSSTISASDAHSGNGLSLDSLVTVTVDYTNSTARLRINESGAFTNTVAGSYGKFVFQSGVYAAFSGKYKVFLVDVSGAWIDIDLAYISDDTAILDCWIGGAVPIVSGSYDLQDVLDDTTIGSAASQDVDIYVTSASTVTLTTTIVIDVGGGSSTTRKRMLACDSSYAYSKGSVTFDTTSNLTNGLIQLGTGSGISYVEIIGLIIDGGAGATDAERGIYCADATTDNISIIDCTIKDVTEAPGHGLSLEGDSYFVINTEIDNCLIGAYMGGSDGLYSRWEGCSIHHCIGDGLYVDGVRNVITHTEFFRNGDDGLVITDTGGGAYIDHCTFLLNTGDGVSVNVAALDVFITNCASSGNGGYGYNISDNNVFSLGIFGYNHSYNETDCSDTGTWATLGIGNNITGDPKFNNTGDGTEDLDLQASSPLIGAGVNGSNSGSGNHAAGGGGGGVKVHPGMTGGISG